MLTMLAFALQRYYYFLKKQYLSIIFSPGYFIIYGNREHGAVQLLDCDRSFRRLQQWSDL